MWSTLRLACAQVEAIDTQEFADDNLLSPVQAIGIQPVCGVLRNVLECTELWFALQMRNVHTETNATKQTSQRS